MKHTIELTYQERDAILDALIESDWRDNPTLARAIAVLRGEAPRLFLGLASVPCENCGGEFIDHGDAPFMCPGRPGAARNEASGSPQLQPPQESQDGGKVDSDASD